MEKTTDILNNIKERVSSPFIFSFLLTWLFRKWEVIVALFWYDLSQIKAEGYPSIYKFIQAHKGDICDNFWWPLLFAICYTIITPLIKMGVKLLHALINKWTDNRIFNITKESNISFDKYVKLKVKNQEQSDQLKKLIDEEETIKSELESTKEVLETTRKERRETDEKLVKLQSIVGSIKRIDILQGKWKCNVGEAEYNVEINGNNFYVNDKYDRRDTSKSNMVTNFYYLHNDKTVFFTRYDNHQKHSFPNELTYESANVLTGNEEGTPISYRRI